MSFGSSRRYAVDRSMILDRLPKVHAVIDENLIRDHGFFESANGAKCDSRIIGAIKFVKDLDPPKG